MKLTLRGSPHCLELSGAGPQPPCISGQGEPEIDAPWQCVFQSSPSLRRPVFLAPTRGSYIYEAQHL